MIPANFVHADDSRDRSRAASRLALTLAVVAVVATFVAGVRWGTFAVGGSDSHCYAGQARMFVEGRLSLPTPLSGPVGWPSAPATFAPFGFAPSADASGASVPLCPAGLSLMMAGAEALAGSRAIFFVVPLLGAVGVWWTYLLGRRVGDPWIGAAAALLMACSPIFLYQLMQPMSDVPAAAFWIGSLAIAAGSDSRPGARTLARACGAGLLAGLAVMMRPNLVPLVVVPVLLAGLSRAEATAGFTTRSRGQKRAVDASLETVSIDGPTPVLPRWLNMVAVLAGVIPGIAAVAWLQFAIYGSPVRSGYGDLGHLFSVSHVATNVVRYPVWLATAHTPILALGLLAPWLAGSRRTAAWLLVGFVLGLFALYLPYVVYSEWWYSRFLLPAVPVLIVLMLMVVSAALAARSSNTFRAPSSAIRETGSYESRPCLAGGAGLLGACSHFSDTLLARTRSTWRRGVLVTLAIVLGAWWVHRAADLAVFRLQGFERKYVELGRYASSRLPAGTVVLAAQPAGSIRYYARLPTLSWDAITPAWLDRVLEDVRAGGHTPMIAVESFELAAFRSHFAGHSPLASLDWPPRADLGRAIVIYDPADRARYLAGEQIRTERITWIVR